MWPTERARDVRTRQPRGSEARQGKSAGGGGRGGAGGDFGGMAPDDLPDVVSGRGRVCKRLVAADGDAMNGDWSAVLSVTPHTRSLGGAGDRGSDYRAGTQYTVSAIQEPH